MQRGAAGWGREGRSSNRVPTNPVVDLVGYDGAIAHGPLPRPSFTPRQINKRMHRLVAAAIANAIFDATGVRIRRVPFCPTG